MKTIKKTIGLILILSAVSSFLFWEIKGRDMVLKEEVLIATQEIFPGSTISSDNIGITGVLESNLVKGAMPPVEISKLEGRKATAYIPCNAQVTELMVEADSDISIRDGESIYVLDGDWLAMKSSSLRRGDQVTIYGVSSRLPVGTYQVAFVKDDMGREVKNSINLYHDFPLKRDESTSRVDSIEIICDPDSYARILDVIEKESSGKLMIVQEGNNG